MGTWVLLQCDSTAARAAAALLVSSWAPVVGGAGEQVIRGALHQCDGK